MTDQLIAETTWIPEKQLVVTHLSGEAEQADIATWEASLQEALAQIPDDSTFRILVNIYGFQAADLEAHKTFRTIGPLTLAAYGWKVGYVNLFEEEAKSLNYSSTRGIKCVAAAHCHQDATKIERYQTNFGRPNEQFFTDPEQARRWLESL
ncbi:hypothetical protein [Adhaeribacter soli]|uniref:STAS/SEC14 domain-containing protein n=1 Tax=Adhaeribacter soli TaxID=2607655 RepID=A0A5N1J6E3_9BACT|nr:hypothetical protein [Adhaeribacter soli]KAA9340173.1 hypothetical protein F0P94_07445 [Adhaeribacter soli]